MLPEDETHQLNNEKHSFGGKGLDGTAERLLLRNVYCRESCKGLDETVITVKQADRWATQTLLDTT